MRMHYHYHHERANTMNIIVADKQNVPYCQNGI
jgi:hypothetical protein